MARGSSHVWTVPFTKQVRSAWSAKGANGLRLTIDNGRIVGALIIGEQTLANPLRQLIEDGVDVSNDVDRMMNANGRLPRIIHSISTQKKR